jgi:ATP-dependent Lon protease
LKSKLLAAWRQGLSTVLVPEVNGKDLPDVPKEVRAGLEIVLVGHMDAVLRHALAWPDGAPAWLGPRDGAHQSVEEQREPEKISLPDG